MPPTMPWLTSLALGQNPNALLIEKFGFRAGVDTTERDIHNYSGPLYWATTATKVRIKAGGNAADTAAGIGARGLILSQIGADGKFLTQTLATAGAAASAWAPLASLRNWRTQVGPVGEFHGTNVGAIVLEDENLNVVGYIEAGEGQSQTSAFTVPVDHVALLHLPAASTDGNKNVNIHWRCVDEALLNLTSGFTAQRLMRHLPGLQGESAPDGGPVWVAAGTDIWATAAALAATSGVSVRYGIELHKVVGP